MRRWTRTAVLSHIYRSAETGWKLWKIQTTQLIFGCFWGDCRKINTISSLWRRLNWKLTDGGFSPAHLLRGLRSGFKWEVKQSTLWLEPSGDLGLQTRSLRLFHPSSHLSPEPGLGLGALPCGEDVSSLVRFFTLLLKWTRAEGLSASCHFDQRHEIQSLISKTISGELNLVARNDPRDNMQTHIRASRASWLSPPSMACAKLPGLNYKCFRGLELQDIMKQCGTLRGNYPAALCSPCEEKEKMNSQSTKPLTPQKFHLPSPPPSPSPWFWGAWKR